MGGFPPLTGTPIAHYVRYGEPLCSGYAREPPHTPLSPPVDFKSRGQRASRRGDHWSPALESRNNPGKYRANGTTL